MECHLIPELLIASYYFDYSIPNIFPINVISILLFLRNKINPINSKEQNQVKYMI